MATITEAGNPRAARARCDVVEDAIYPLNLADDSGKPLDGANKYTITFEKGAAPPVNAFWSITLYDQEDSRSVTP